MKIATSPWRMVQALLLAAALSVGTAAMAQTEPTLNQVYAAAQSGKLDQAQLMIQQVLIGHPNSAKAHFVRAELYARQVDLTHARASLATAESISPTLAFAKPEAVLALRTQLGKANALTSVASPASNSFARPATGAATTAPAAARAPEGRPSATSSMVLPLVLVGGVLVFGYFAFRKRVPQAGPQTPAYTASGNGLNGPQSFGMGSGQSPYPQGGYPQPAGNGMGGRIMGGVATGLAVGAGVLAAEAIGRSFMGHHNSASAGQPDRTSGDNFQPIADPNRDMGGNDFGVNDSSSWDDGGSSSDSGGDWDN